MKMNADSVFIYPTDTVWGIGASIYSQLAYKEIAAIKKTSEDKPLSIMFTDIDELYKSFNFPAEITKEWLKKYFAMESTLGIPLSFSKIIIPKWVTGASDLVSVRCLDDKLLKEISTIIKAPFFTTSLNLTGNAPITAFDEAKEFHATYARDAFFYGEKNHNLSGQSSTIVFLRNKSFEVIRAGLQAEKIKKHLGLTGFTIS